MIGATLGAAPGIVEKLKEEQKALQDKAAK
jgi:hypothetical protein